MFTGLIRTIILYLLIIAGIRLMGKRQVGELEPSELVLSLIIADLAAVPMQDFGIPLLTGIVPILTLLCLTMILSVLTMKSIRFRALMCGRPSIIVPQGADRPGGDAPQPADGGRAAGGAAGPGVCGSRRNRICHPGDQRPAVYPALGAGEAPHPEPAGAGGGGDRAAPGAHQ